MQTNFRIFTCAFLNGTLGINRLFDYSSIDCDFRYAASIKFHLTKAASDAGYKSARITISHKIKKLCGLAVIHFKLVYSVISIACTSISISIRRSS